jgi:hypothetical protein
MGEPGYSKVIGIAAGYGLHDREYKFESRLGQELSLFYVV